MVEKDFIKEIESKIAELKDSESQTDSRLMQEVFRSQREILNEIALPQAKIYAYNLGILTECIHKKDSIISQLHSEILSLKGELNIK